MRSASAGRCPAKNISMERTYSSMSGTEAVDDEGLPAGAGGDDKLGG